MRALFYSLLGYFLTPAGVVAMAALDSSVVFFLPLGIDVVVIIMAARRPEWFWVYAVLATAGKHQVSSLGTWLVLESAFYALQFAIVGPLIGSIYGKAAARPVRPAA